MTVKHEAMTRVDWRSHSNFEDYNGWTNCETWAVNLWAGELQVKELGIFDHAFEKAGHWNNADPDEGEAFGSTAITAAGWNTLHNDVADALEEFFVGDYCQLREIVQTRGTGYGFSDVRDDIGSFWRVQWREVAEHFVDEWWINQ